MDFLDNGAAASPGTDAFSGFLGVDLSKVSMQITDFTKRKLSFLSPSFEKKLMQQYPFSDICADQSDLIGILREQANQVMLARDKQDRDTRAWKQLDSKVRVYDDYITRAEEHLKKVSCATKKELLAGDPVVAGDTVIGTVATTVNIMEVPAAINTTTTPQKQLISGVDNDKLLKYAVVGITILAAYKIFIKD